jgi:hypothetical protein
VDGCENDIIAFIASASVAMRKIAHQVLPPPNMAGPKCTSESQNRFGEDENALGRDVCKGFGREGTKLSRAATLIVGAFCVDGTLRIVLGPLGRHLFRFTAQIASRSARTARSHSTLIATGAQSQNPPGPGLRQMAPLRFLQHFMQPTPLHAAHSVAFHFLHRQQNPGSTSAKPRCSSSSVKQILHAGFGFQGMFSHHCGPTVEQPLDRLHANCSHLIR